MTTRPHEESTTGRWERVPFLARIAGYMTFAIDTWMLSVMLLHGFDADLNHQNTPPDYGSHVPSITRSPYRRVPHE